VKEPDREADIMKKEEKLTYPMEDYIEMIYRLSQASGFTRIQEVSKRLNVQPPSATRMIQKLANIGLVNYQKYGVITLTDTGRQQGNLLLKRHNTIENFLKCLGVNKDILEETEKIEHTISSETLMRIIDLLGFFEDNPEILKRFYMYKRSKI